MIRVIRVIGFFGIKGYDRLVTLKTHSATHCKARETDFTDDYFVEDSGIGTNRIGPKTIFVYELFEAWVVSRAANDLLRERSVLE